MKLKLHLGLLSLLLFSGFAVQAVTTAQFFGMQGMINIGNHVGQTDADAETLFNDMNVPIQDSPMMGPGKAITTEGKILNFICANRGSGQFNCTVIIQRSGNSKLSADHMAFEVVGEGAQAFNEKFHPNQADGSYHFVSTDGLFEVLSTSQRFLVKFQK